MYVFITFLVVGTALAQDPTRSSSRGQHIRRAPLSRGEWAENLKLLGTHACAACHQIDKRVVGPSFGKPTRRRSPAGC